MEVCLKGLHSKRRCPPLGTRSPLGSAVMALRSKIACVVQLRQEDGQSTFVECFKTPPGRLRRRNPPDLVSRRKISRLSTWNLRSGGLDYRMLDYERPTPITAKRYRTTSSKAKSGISTTLETMYAFLNAESPWDLRKTMLILLYRLPTSIIPEGRRLEPDRYYM